MPRRITATTLILLAGCGGVHMKVKSGRTLSYAQYHSLESGTHAKSILHSFGPPADTLEQDGRISGLTYRCDNAAGKVEELRMVFTVEERIEKWALHAPEPKE